MARVLTGRGHRVVVVAKREIGKGICEYDTGTEVHYVRFGSIHYYLSKIPLLKNILTLPVRQIEWGFAIWRKVKEIHQRAPFDVVEGPELGNLFNVLFLKGAPLIIRSHGSTYSFRKNCREKIHLGELLDRKIELFTLRRAQAISVPSKFKALEIHLSFRDQTRESHVIPNPLPLELSEVPKDNSLPRNLRSNKSAMVLYAGRLASVKGVRTLLNAAPKVISEFPQTTFIFVGGFHSSIAKEEIRGIIRELHLGKHVVLTGHVPWRKLINYYLQATVFVMPSFYESFCIAVLEAMASSLPVIASDVGALPDLVEDGITGFLVEPGNPEALARKIIAVFSDKNLQRRMGNTGRKKVLENYSAEVIVELATSLYERVAYVAEKRLGA
jgi:glycosyltransferase involved in cell wall biosynthesis